MKNIIRLTLMLLLFVGVTVLSAYFSFSFFIHSEGNTLVPELVGKDVVYALEVLTELGLNTKVKGAEYNPNIAKNHIIFQDPDAGEEIRKGRDVRLILSKGEQTIITPKVTGLSEMQARFILEENDLCQGIISRTTFQNSPPNEVISQTPHPGSLIFREACVDLLVSSGPRFRTFKMPRFVGSPVDEAIVRIENQGFRLGKVEQIFDVGRNRNSVVGQEPMEGSLIAYGQAVNLHVNGDMAPVGNRDRRSIADAGVLHYRADKGFLRKKIRIRISTNKGYEDIYEEFTDPGTDVWITIPTDLYTEVFLYEDDEISYGNKYLAVP